MGISVVGGSTGTAGKTLRVQTFTTEGANTFTLPSGYGPDNPLAVELLLVGAGGGAGAGNYQNTTDSTLAGAGGGGGVKKLNISITENMTAHVGYRGYGGRGPSTYSFGADSAMYVGGNGGYTYFGNSTPKNLFLNPQFIAHSNYTAESYVISNFDKTSNQTFDAAISGNIAYNGSWTSTSQYRRSQPYSVKPSTNYCFSIYMRTPISSTARVEIQWFTSASVIISTETGSSISTPANTWARVSVGGTSPANAAFCTFRLRQVGTATGDCYISNAMFEEGVTTPSTYVDGATAGHSWAGHPAGSVTISNSDAMYVASGGGGGGAIFNGSTSWSSAYWNLGFPGASSGGGAMTNVSSTQSLTYGGSGGGAGGHATQKKDNYWTYSTSGASLRGDNKSPFFNTLAENGYGALGQGFSGAGSSISPDITLPGPGIDGYGAGGQSQMWTLNGTPREMFYFESEETMYSIINAPSNTGNGGSVRWMRLDSTFYLCPGGNGGSGLIVVKYWE